MSHDDIKRALVTDRPQTVAYRPERVSATPNRVPWTVRIGGVVTLINEDLLAKMYPDRRKAGRKIRQQRRKLRRVNAEFGHGLGEGVPESLLRVKVSIR